MPYAFPKVAKFLHEQLLYLALATIKMNIPLSLILFRLLLAQQFWY